MASRSSTSSPNGTTSNSTSPDGSGAVAPTEAFSRATGAGTAAGAGKGGFAPARRRYQAVQIAAPARTLSSTVARKRLDRARRRRAEGREIVVVELPVATSASASRRAMDSCAREASCATGAGRELLGAAPIALPARLRLPTGDWTAVLRYPVSGELAALPLRVVAGEALRLEHRFARLEARAYFEATGW